jgi:hypothetical protein
MKSRRRIQHLLRRIMVQPIALGASCLGLRRWSPKSDRLLGPQGWLEFATLLGMRKMARNIVAQSFLKQIVCYLPHATYLR